MLWLCTLNWISFKIQESYGTPWCLPLWDWESPLLPTSGLQNKIQKEDYSLWSLPMYYDFNMWILVCISYWVLLKASRYIYFQCLSECQYINYHNIFTVPKYGHRKVEEDKRLEQIAIVNCSSGILVCISEICIGLMDTNGTPTLPRSMEKCSHRLQEFLCSNEKF